MRTFGNILWLILFGFITALLHFIGGIICCITLIFIPIGIQQFKIAKLAIWPFGKRVITNFDRRPFLNMVWILLFGGVSYITLYFVGLIFCLTIIGIPFGIQFFKLAKLGFTPFGAEVYSRG